MAIPIIAGQVVGTHFLDLFYGGENFVQGKDVVGSRVFGIFHRGAVRFDAHDLFAQFFVGLEEIDERYLFTDIRHLQRMNKWKADEVGNFEVFIEDFDDIEERTFDIHGKTGSTLDTHNVKNKYPQIFEWIPLFDFFMSFYYLVFSTSLSRKKEVQWKE